MIKVSTREESFRGSVVEEVEERSEEMTEAPPSIITLLMPTDAIEERI